MEGGGQTPPPSWSRALDFKVPGLSWIFPGPHLTHLFFFFWAPVCHYVQENSARPAVHVEPTPPRHPESTRFAASVFVSSEADETDSGFTRFPSVPSFAPIPPSLF